MINHNFINFRKVNETNNLYRTGRCFGTSKDMNFLKDKSIDIFIDLRAKNEIDEIYTNFEKIKGIDYLNIPLEDKNSSFYEIESPLENDYIRYYLNIFSDNIGAIRNIFRYLVNTHHTNLLVGCNFGKDRTGIFLYLLLTIMNVKKETVFSDYACSSEYLKNNKTIQSLYPNKNKLAFNPNIAIIKGFDDSIFHKFRNVNELRKYLKVNEKECQLLRSRYL